MSRRRMPHNPAAVVHDRRTTEFNRGIAAHMAVIEVDCPIDAGTKLMVLRNTRNDPLAGMHARKFIDEAQYQAGRAFQDDFETAERGPRAIDPGKEAVDGGRLPEPITEAQQKAVRRLAQIHRALGVDGSSIVADVLIEGIGISQLVTRRGYQGEYYRKYFGKRFGECLDRLALEYGFSNGPRK